MKIKLYSHDEYGNIIESYSDTGFYGEPIYNPRIWSEKKPEEAPEGTIYIMDRINPGWQLIEDTRGTWYKTATGEEICITKVGIPREGLTKLKPVDAFQRWNGEKWLPDNEKKAAYDKQQAAIQEALNIQKALLELAQERLREKTIPAQPTR